MGNVYVKHENEITPLLEKTDTIKTLNKTLVMNAGYKEFTNLSSVDVIPLFTEEEIKEIMNIETIDWQKTFVFVNNADSTVSDAHLLPCTFTKSLSYGGNQINNVWCIKANIKITGSLAITYCIMYFNDETTQMGAYVKNEDGFNLLISGFDKGNVKHIIVGSTIKSRNDANSIPVVSATEISGYFLNEATNKNTLLICSNGDGPANPVHIEGCTYVPSDKGWRVVLPATVTTSDPLRINFITIGW